MFLGPVGLVMLANALFWLLLLVGLGFLVAGGLRRWSTAPRGPEDALSILEVRYARGEVGREAFLQMRKDLTASRSDGEPK